MSRESGAGAHAGADPLYRRVSRARDEPMANSTPYAHAVPVAQWIGREIAGRYRILEVLAEGGMGAVFLAEHLGLHKQVALKTIRPEFAADSVAEARFAREVQATGQIDHPHVVSALDCGLLPEGGSYLVIQLVQGETLVDRMKRGAMPWQQVCLLGSQVADALATVHAVGIVHRDLKPENILLEQRPDARLHARVVDFGIARVSEEINDRLAAPQALTRIGAVIGTPGYMPPEQAVGRPADFRADLYALGVILWECCAGRLLWADNENLSEMTAIQLAGPATSLRKVCPGTVPQALAVLVERLLELTPADRPASAAEVRDELRRLAMRGELEGVARPLTMAGLPAVRAPFVPPTVEVVYATPRTSLWIGAAVACLVAVALAVYLAS